jgi:putative flippase GtrA
MKQVQQTYAACSKAQQHVVVSACCALLCTVLTRQLINNVVVFARENYQAGQWVMVEIERSTAATLLGKAVGYARIPR